MKSNPGLILFLLASTLAVMPPSHAAQPFTTIYSFTNGIDGANPYAGLILSGSTFYGTTCNGGPSSHGSLFALNTNGTGFSNVISFATGADGNPVANLLLSGNTLYGTLSSDFLSQKAGGVFKVNTDGSGFTTLYTFTDGYDGGNPEASVILSGNTLYGTANSAGSYQGGTLFTVDTSGNGFTTLHSFGSFFGDGQLPHAGVVMSGTTLYGAGDGGGTNYTGTLYSMDVSGANYTNIHTFSSPVGINHTNSDGWGPYGSLILSGNTLYGTTVLGGAGGNGVVFSMKTDGTGFTTLHSFSLAAQHTPNSDGANPQAALILAGNTLYGTTIAGGIASQGTIFSMSTNGTAFRSLYSFNDGGWPNSLVLNGNTLYGTTRYGGSKTNGSVFSLLLPPPALKIVCTANNVILSWPTNSTTYTLQTSPGIGSAANWTSVSPQPVIVGGQNVVTNALSGTQHFFRLIQ